MSGKCFCLCKGWGVIAMLQLVPLPCSSQGLLGSQELLLGGAGVAVAVGRGGKTLP